MIARHPCVDRVDVEELHHAGKPAIDADGHAAQVHKLWLGTGKKTCIDCHKGVAHRLPDMTGVPQG